MNSESHPILYSYRRCPYAMRARMGIYLAGLQVEQREIVFWDKPESMLTASPKGTVPVLVLPDGRVIDESLDILLWALRQSASGLVPSDLQVAAEVAAWIELNDGEFKTHLDVYKYSQDEVEKQQVRAGGEAFLRKIEKVLLQQSFLVGDKLSVADIAIFPFVRQFAHVDKLWFSESGYAGVRNWLDRHLQSDYFINVMRNRPVWQDGHKPLWVSEKALTTRNQFVAKAEGWQADC
ncbi:MULTISPECIES: glutathione S-transferase [Thiomicrorhabdus]|uniref:Glutathione S-transferase n=1 Tax=Thiomicrorhabdus heinhorstiae TaxID=2748010 RepID=A0ABS0BY40_9GAMM|nr:MULTISPECIES: glutathione S-transferase [Thiomicrorhabdus]MBF6058329.1 glutathione S-transferase [Thiomicrorhabdus heinhorstiae]